MQCLSGCLVGRQYSSPPRYPYFPPRTLTAPAYLPYGSCLVANFLLSPRKIGPFLGAYNFDFPPPFPFNMSYNHNRTNPNALSRRGQPAPPTPSQAPAPPSSSGASRLDQRQQPAAPGSRRYHHTSSSAAQGQQAQPIPVISGTRRYGVPARGGPASRADGTHHHGGRPAYAHAHTQTSETLSAPHGLTILVPSTSTRGDPGGRYPGHSRRYVLSKVLPQICLSSI